MPAPTDAQWAALCASLYAVNIVFAVIATIMVCLRCYTRFRLQRIYGAEDAFLILALVCTLVFSGTRISFDTRFLRNNAEDIDPSDYAVAEALAWASQTFGFLAHVAGRFAVCILLYRILNPNLYMKIFLQFIMVTLVLTLVTCLAAIWVTWPAFGVVLDLSVLQRLSHAIWGCYTYWCLLDFVFALLPIHMLYKLQIKLQRKLRIGALLGLGVFTGICSTVKLVYLFTSITDADDNTTFREFSIAIWNSLELYLIIIATCIAVIRPLVLKMMGRAYTPQYTPSGQRTRSGMYGRSKRSSRLAIPDHNDLSISGNTRLSVGMGDGNGSDVLLSPIRDSGFERHRGEQQQQAHGVADKNFMTVEEIPTVSRASSFRHSVENQIGSAV